MNKELKSIRINAVSENRIDLLIGFHYDQLKLYSVAKMVHYMVLGNLDIHIQKNRAVLSPHTTQRMGVKVLSPKTD